MYPRMAFALALLLIAAPLAAPSAADSATQPSSTADYSATKLLAAAQASVKDLEQQQDPTARAIDYRGAMTGLIGLYELHGCEWAYPRLLEITGQPDCPEMYYGISADGRLAVTIDRLDLRNTVFDGYAIYLCSVESLTAVKLSHTDADKSALTFKLAGGNVVVPEKLAPGHPLWEQLSRLSRTFIPPEAVYPGNSVSFKQAFRLSAEQQEDIESAIVTWGGYQLEIPDYRHIKKGQQ